MPQCLPVLALVLSACFSLAAESATVVCTTRIVDAAGQPLGGASIHWQQYRSRTIVRAKADANGVVRCELDRSAPWLLQRCLLPGEDIYDIHATEGPLTLHAAAGHVLNIPKSAAACDLRIVLGQPERRLRGRVQTASGEPLAAATLFLYRGDQRRFHHRREYDLGHKRRRVPARAPHSNVQQGCIWDHLGRTQLSVRTDVDGRFEKALPPGDYTVVDLIPAGMSNQSLMVAAPSRISIAHDDQTLDLTTKAGGCLRCRLTGQDGQPAAGFRLTLVGQLQRTSGSGSGSGKVPRRVPYISRQQGLRRLLRSDAQGQAVFAGLPKGTYTLQVARPDGGQGLSETWPVEYTKTGIHIANDPMTELALSLPDLTARFACTITVVDEQGQALVGAKVESTGNPPQHMGVTDASGRLRILRDRIGAIALRARPATGVDLPSVWQSVRLPADNAQLRLTVPTPWQITGSIVSDAPVQDLSALNIQAHVQGHDPVTATSDAAGHFTMHVAAGAMSLVVSDPKERFADTRLQLQGQPGSTLALPIRLQAVTRAKLSGRVLDQDGQGVPGITIQVGTRTGISGEDGSYELPAVSAHLTPTVTIPPELPYTWQPKRKYGYDGSSKIIDDPMINKLNQKEQALRKEMLSIRKQLALQKGAGREELMKKLQDRMASLKQLVESRAELSHRRKVPKPAILDPQPVVASTQSATADRRLDFHVTREHVLRLRVLDSQGAPLAGYGLALLHYASSGLAYDEQREQLQRVTRYAAMDWRPDALPAATAWRTSNAMGEVRFRLAKRAARQVYFVYAYPGPLCPSQRQLSIVDAQSDPQQLTIHDGADLPLTKKDGAWRGDLRLMTTPALRIRTVDGERNPRTSVLAVRLWSLKDLPVDQRQRPRLTKPALDSWVRSDSAGRLSLRGIVNAHCDVLARSVGEPWLEIAAFRSLARDEQTDLELQKPTVLQVHCVDESGAPVSGVPFQLSGDGRQQQQRSDANGRLRFLSPPGTWRLQAVRSDPIALYGPGKNLLIDPKSRAITLAAGEQREERMVLRRTASLSGRVLNKAGQPIPARLTALLHQGQAKNGRASMTSYAVVNVDNDGAYRFSALTAGTYTIRVAIMKRRKGRMIWQFLPDKDCPQFEITTGNNTTSDITANGEPYPRKEKPKPKPKPPAESADGF